MKSRSYKLTIFLRSAGKWLTKWLTNWLLSGQFQSDRNVPIRDCQKWLCAWKADWFWSQEIFYHGKLRSFIAVQRREESECRLKHGRAQPLTQVDLMCVMQVGHLESLIMVNCALSPSFKASQSIWRGQCMFTIVDAFCPDESYHFSNRKSR